MPYGLVWANLDQSSLVVESCAFAVLAEVAGEDTELVTEFKDIVRAFGEPGAALNYECIAGGLMRSANVADKYKHV